MLTGRISKSENENNKVSSDRKSNNNISPISGKLTFGEKLMRTMNSYGNEHDESVNGSSYEVIPEEFYEDETFTDITPTSEVLSEAIKIINSKEIIDWLVKKSEPPMTDLTGVAAGEDLLKWRQNIVDNYNKLAATTEQQYFDMETERGAYYRKEGQADTLRYLDTKKAKLEYRSDKITNRKDSRGSKRRERKNELKQIRDEKIQNINNSYQTDSETNPNKLQDENMIGNISKDSVKDNPYFNYEESKKTKLEAIKSEKEEIHNKRNAIGKFFSNIVKNVRINIPSSSNYAPIIDPAKDFAFSLNDEKYKFSLAPISIDDIIPLVTPRADDSIIDTAPAPASIEPNIYSRLKGADAKETAEERKNEYNYQLNNVIIANTTIPDPATLKKEWKSEQKKLRVSDLEGKYSRLYGFVTDSYEWINANRDKMGDDATKPYDENGNAKSATRTAFYYWLSMYTPTNVDGAAIKWDNTEMRFVSGKNEPKSNESSTSDDYTNKLNEYQTTQNKANELNELISGGGANAEIKGWNIDKIKQKFLVQLSQDMIEPQKWAENPGSADFKITDQFYKAGTLKETANKKPTLGETSNVRDFTEKEGIYNNESSKRYSGYDETTGYMEKPAKDSTVKETLIWMINYKIKVQQDI